MDERQHERLMRQGIHGYLKYLDRYDSPAVLLCNASVPAWIVHAEKGDGDLTDERTANPRGMPPRARHHHPGTSYFIPTRNPSRSPSSSSLWWL